MHSIVYIRLMYIQHISCPYLLYMIIYIYHVHLLLPAYYLLLYLRGHRTKGRRGQRSCDVRRGRGSEDAARHQPAMSTADPSGAGQSGPTCTTPCTWAFGPSTRVPRMAKAKRQAASVAQPGTLLALATGRLGGGRPAQQALLGRFARGASATPRRLPSCTSPRLTQMGGLCE